MPDLFRARVAAAPDRIAVAAPDRVLTYAELDVRSDALAATLRGSGVGEEDPVAVLMRRSADLIVALLGVMKSGGHYVPIDPDFPADRVHAILTGLDAAAVLADAEFGEHPALRAGTAPVLDAAAVRPAPPPCVLPPVLPGRLAYVMFTSGSTGRPKGVEITHQSLSELVSDPCWELGAADRVLFHAPHAFDASDYEIWVPLTSGARVVVAGPPRLDPAALREQITVHGITHVHITAGMFRVVAEEELEAFGTVREVLTGGDVVPAAAVAALLRGHPGISVRHLYGPTEITLCATQHLLTGPDAVGPGRVPIGAPLADTRAYVLDGALRPVPAGAEGELYLAGAGLARGYAHDPGGTAQRFVADPFGPRGSRMYRTGDLARWRADGVLEFLGRVDDQVKVRGFRVEPAEIEHVLAGHPDVVGSAVVVRADAVGTKRVLAYVVPAGGPDPGLPARLLAHARRSLPAFMVPAAIVVVDGFPLTRNGKLDVTTLPEPGPDRPDGVAPGTPTEATLCELFAELLGVKDVGVHDDFFELGGDSLLAARLVSRAAALLPVEWRIRTVLDTPTVAGLARLADG